MTHKSKLFGLIVMTALMIGMAAVPTVQASHTLWGVGAATGRMKADPTEVSQSFTTTASNITCNEVSASFALGGGESAETVTTSGLKYDNNATGKCVGTGGLEPKFEANGCNYTFHAGATVAGGIESTMDIVCPEGVKGMVINAGFLCTITIPPQNNLGGVRKTNVKTGSKEEVTLDTTVEKTKYSHTGFCGNGSAENGIYHGKATDTTHNASGAQTDLTVT